MFPLDSRGLPLRVYTVGGSTYHIYPDCQHIRGRVAYRTTRTDLGAARVKLCADCLRRFPLPTELAVNA